MGGDISVLNRDYDDDRAAAADYLGGNLHRGFFSCCNELIVVAAVYACRFAENVCMRDWNWRIIVAISVFLACKVWEDYCLFLSNLQDCFIYLSKCGLIHLGAYGGGPPLYRLKKLEAFVLADVLQWNVNIKSHEYCAFHFCLEQNTITTPLGTVANNAPRRTSTTPDMDSILFPSGGDPLLTFGSIRAPPRASELLTPLGHVFDGRTRSTPSASRVASAHVSPVSLQTLMIRRRSNGHTSTSTVGGRKVPDEYPQPHACAKSTECAPRKAISASSRALEPAGLRSLDKGNPFVGKWAHSPAAETIRSLRVLSTDNKAPASKPQSKKRDGKSARVQQPMCI
ncbi:hypothetical protein FOL47_010831 [Perkinsus chesapeaki]|uniref:Cyclin N-terminal domain-containing protein n=1 Tax=Perkinsus chesapeaki TaxID=330153 RepID=A0A7J6MQK0_PERCH|nr:hypothetical protein FOL47_010831 [Perkinsus chesapeaki]